MVCHDLCLWKCTDWPKMSIDLFCPCNIYMVPSILKLQYVWKWIHYKQTRMYENGIQTDTHAQTDSNNHCMFATSLAVVNAKINIGLTLLLCIIWHVAKCCLPDIHIHTGLVTLCSLTANFKTWYNKLVSRRQTAYNFPKTVHFRN